jgi:uncharacterized protein YpuA (DUF1002 family)
MQTLLYYNNSKQKKGKKMKLNELVKSRRLAEKLNKRVYLKPQEQQVAFDALQNVYLALKARITLGDLRDTNTDWDKIPDKLMDVGEAFRPIFSSNEYWAGDFEWILELQEMHRNIASKKPRKQAAA